MRKASIFTILALGAVFLALVHASAQVSSYTLQREKWVMQASSNAVPLACRFTTTVTGVGTLKAGEVRSPATTNALAGSVVQLSYATNFFAASVDGTNLNTGVELLNASFPTGTYTLSVQSKIGPSTLTTNILLDLSRDFPTAAPVFTNVTPWIGLQPVQTFSWPAFSSNAQAYTRFYLLEGAVDTNLVQAVLENGIAALTNSMSVLALELHLPASQTSLTVSGIDTSTDHLALLEFHDPAVVGGVGGLSEAGTVVGGMVFFYGLQFVTEPSSTTAMEGASAAFAALAVGSPPISYQWKFKGTAIAGETNALLFLPSVRLADAGDYTVVAANLGGHIESLAATLAVTPAASVQPVLREWRVVGEDFEFTLQGTAGATYSIEASTNLSDWEVVGQVSSESGTNSVHHQGAMTHAWRFYRAKEVH